MQRGGNPMKVNPDKAATVGAFLWRYKMALYRCMGEAAPSSASAGLAREIEDGIHVFEGHITVDASLWPPITNDTKHRDVFAAIILLDDLAMPELLNLARWRKFVHNNGPMPKRPEPEPDFSFRACYWGKKQYPTNINPRAESNPPSLPSAA
jgi:hypothetical protein